MRQKMMRKGSRAGAISKYRPGPPKGPHVGHMTPERLSRDLLFGKGSPVSHMPGMGRAPPPPPRPARPPWAPLRIFKRFPRQPHRRNVKSARHAPPRAAAAGDPTKVPASVPLPDVGTFPPACAQSVARGALSQRSPRRRVVRPGDLFAAGVQRCPRRPVGPAAGSAGHLAVKVPAPAARNETTQRFPRQKRPPGGRARPGPPKKVPARD